MTTVLTAAAAAQVSTDEWTIERVESSWPVAAGAAVRVDNPLGSIWVRKHDRDEVYVLSNVQRHPDDPRTLDLRHSTTDGELRLDVSFLDVELDGEPEAWKKRRIDVTLFVPAEAPTHFSTRSGLVEVRGTRGATEVETVTGQIKLRVGGAAVARTENGEVLAQFFRTDWDRPVEISSSTGPIRVEMPQGGKAGVVIETRGEITSDFSTQIEWVENSLLKRATLTVGESGMPMKLSSQQGSIKILQSLVPAEDGE